MQPPVLFQAQAPAVPAPAPLAPPAIGDLSGQPATALQSQLIDISRQIQGLNVQRDIAVARSAGAEGADAARLNAEIARIDANVARLSARREEIMARIVRTQVEHQIAVPPPFVQEHLIDPDAITAVFVMFSIGIIFPLSVGLMRRLWRRTPTQAPAREADLVASPRLDRLEQAVDAIAIEIERISEGQRFVTKVLTERGTVARPASNGEASDAAGVGEAKPFLALGAGPIEPIRVGERQTVRQSITPH